MDFLFSDQETSSQDFLFERKDYLAWETNWQTTLLENFNSDEEINRNDNDEKGDSLIANPSTESFNTKRSNKIRGNYKTFSIDQKKEMINLLESKPESFGSVAEQFGTTVRRVKAIFKKRRNLQSSGRKSRNLAKNNYLFARALEYQNCFGVRPSILALPKFFLKDEKYFSSNGMKTNFSKNLKTFLLARGVPLENVNQPPHNEARTIAGFSELQRISSIATPGDISKNLLMNAPQENPENSIERGLFHSNQEKDEETYSSFSYHSADHYLFNYV